MSLTFPATRWSLVGRLGDHPEATAVLLELYFDSIARYLRLRFPDEVRTGEIDDVIQEVAIHLVEHPSLLAAAKPGQGSRFRYLLMTVAFNAARNALRTRLRRRSKDSRASGDEDLPLSELLEDPYSTQATVAMDRAWAESILDQSWNDVRAWAGEGRLEPACIEVLEYSMKQGQSVREMAPALGMSPATCQRRLARGRTFLQRAIVDRLTQAGELSPEGDPSHACDILLGLLRPQ